jgi:glycosyltransferase involved in cell wall biosynthesis
MTAPLKRLLVVSHTAHYIRDGEPVGWGATVRELDHLAKEFERVRHIAFLHPGPGPASALAYRSSRIELVAVPPSGGSGVRAKMGILAALPTYLPTLLAQLRWADAVHVRAPASISLLAVLLLSLVRRPRTRWVKYAGNWKRYPGEPRSYALQRWWLGHGWHRGITSVNGRWPDQPAHVVSFLNPCLSTEELLHAREVARNKTLDPPVRLLFVGRLEEAKGVGRCIEILHALRGRGVDARLDLVGDGPERRRFETLASAPGLEGRVRFLGWLPRSAIDPLYAAAHFLLLPSTCSEGWPKVLSEAMAFGAVPLAGAVSSIPQYLEEFQAGASLAPEDVHGFADAIGAYVREPDRWATHARNAARAAERFTYDRYLDAVMAVLAPGGHAASIGGETPPAGTSGIALRTRS